MRPMNGKKTANDGDAATLLAVQALSYIAGDTELFERFLNLTGLDVANLRAAARDPGFLVGVLDFLLGHEPTLLGFAGQADVAPERVSQARQQLAGSQPADFS